MTFLDMVALALFLIIMVELAIIYHLWQTKKTRPQPVTIEVELDGARASIQQLLKGVVYNIEIQQTAPNKILLTGTSEEKPTLT